MYRKGFPAVEQAGMVNRDSRGRQHYRQAECLLLQKCSLHYYIAYSNGITRRKSQFPLTKSAAKLTSSAKKEALDSGGPERKTQSS